MSEPLPALLPARRAPPRADRSAASSVVTPRRPDSTARVWVPTSSALRDHSSQSPTTVPSAAGSVEGVAACERLQQRHRHARCRRSTRRRRGRSVPLPNVRRCRLGGHGLELVLRAEGVSGGGGDDGADGAVELGGRRASSGSPQGWSGGACSRSWTPRARRASSYLRARRSRTSGASGATRSGWVLWAMSAIFTARAIGSAAMRA